MPITFPNPGIPKNMRVLTATFLDRLGSVEEEQIHQCFMTIFPRLVRAHKDLLSDWDLEAQINFILKRLVLHLDMLFTTGSGLPFCDIVEVREDQINRIGVHHVFRPGDTHSLSEVICNLPQAILIRALYVESNPLHLSIPQLRVLIFNQHLARFLAMEAVAAKFNLPEADPNRLTMSRFIPNLILSMVSIRYTVYYPIINNIKWNFFSNFLLNYQDGVLLPCFTLPVDNSNYFQEEYLELLLSSPQVMENFTKIFDNPRVRFLFNGRYLDCSDFFKLVDNHYQVIIAPALLDLFERVQLSLSPDSITLNKMVALILKNAKHASSNSIFLQNDNFIQELQNLLDSDGLGCPLEQFLSLELSAIKAFLTPTIRNRLNDGTGSDRLLNIDEIKTMTEAVYCAFLDPECCSWLTLPQDHLQYLSTAEFLTLDDFKIRKLKDPTLVACMRGETNTDRPLTKQEVWEMQEITYQAICNPDIWLLLISDWQDPAHLFMDVFVRLNADKLTLLFNSELIKRLKDSCGADRCLSLAEILLIPKSVASVYDASSPNCALPLLDSRQVMVTELLSYPFGFQRPRTGSVVAHLQLPLSNPGYLCPRQLARARTFFQDCIEVPNIQELIRRKIINIADLINITPHAGEHLLCEVNQLITQETTKGSFDEFTFIKKCSYIYTSSVAGMKLQYPQNAEEAERARVIRTLHRTYSDAQAYSECILSHFRMGAYLALSNPEITQYLNRTRYPSNYLKSEEILRISEEVYKALLNPNIRSLLTIKQILDLKPVAIKALSDPRVYSRIGSTATDLALNDILAFKEVDYKIVTEQNDIKQVLLIETRQSRFAYMLIDDPMVNYRINLPADDPRRLTLEHLKSASEWAARMLRVPDIDYYLLLPEDNPCHLTMAEIMHANSFNCKVFEDGGLSLLFRRGFLSKNRLWTLNFTNITNLPFYDSIMDRLTLVYPQASHDFKMNRLLNFSTALCYILANDQLTQFYINQYVEYKKQQSASKNFTETQQNKIIQEAYIKLISINEETASLFSQPYKIYDAFYRDNVWKIAILDMSRELSQFLIRDLNYHRLLLEKNHANHLTIDEMMMINQRGLMLLSACPEMTTEELRVENAFITDSKTMPRHAVKIFKAFGAHQVLWNSRVTFNSTSTMLSLFRLCENKPKELFISLLYTFSNFGESRRLTPMREVAEFCSKPDRYQIIQQEFRSHAKFYMHHNIFGKLFWLLMLFERTHLKFKNHPSIDIWLTCIAPYLFRYAPLDLMAQEELKDIHGYVVEEVKTLNIYDQQIRAAEEVADDDGDVRMLPRNAP